MIEERARVELRTETAAAVLAELGVPSVHDDLRIDCMRSGNEVFRVTIGADAFFVKIPAKDLEAWPDPLEGAAMRSTSARCAPGWGQDETGERGSHLPPALADGVCRESG